MAKAGLKLARRSDDVTVRCGGLCFTCFSSIQREAI
jgi:hypothetical protein